MNLWSKALTGDQGRFAIAGVRECHQAPPSREGQTETSLNTQVHLVAWARFPQPVSGNVVPSRRIKISKVDSFFSPCCFVR